MQLCMGEAQVLVVLMRPIFLFPFNCRSTYLARGQVSTGYFDVVTGGLFRKFVPGDLVSLSSAAPPSPSSAGAGASDGASSASAGASGASGAGATPASGVDDLGRPTGEGIVEALVTDKGPNWLQVPQ